MNLDALLAKAVELGASDIFIVAGRPICIKVDGKIENLTQDELTPDKAKLVVFGLMSPKQQDEFIVKKEFNFALQTRDAGRFRISAFFEKFNVGAVLRRIKARIPGLSELGLPAILTEISMAQRGFVLVVGGTGTGKSTTLASMLHHRNLNSCGHIITIEDPIEYVHKHEKCLITQREVGLDTDSWEIALQNVLRQAPDVILIGEIRSQETMEYGLQFAETGHLCLATLHANNANQALERILSFFPANSHQQILLELSMHLKAIVAQQLIPRSDGKGQVPAIEVMLNTPVIQACIKRGESDVIKDYIAKGRDLGMQTFDQSLYDLYRNGVISYDDALHHADSENEVRLMVKLNDKFDGSKDNGSLDGVKLQE